MKPFSFPLAPCGTYPRLGATSTRKDGQRTLPVTGSQGRAGPILRTVHPLPAVALSATLIAGCAAGCTSSQGLPRPSEFRAGSCQHLAPDILQVAADADRLGAGSTPPSDVRDALARAQGRLRTSLPDSSHDLAAATNDVIVAIGVVRLGSDTNAYTPAAGADMGRAAKRVIALCVGGT